MNIDEIYPRPSLEGMTERGITNTAADYWVHFFPLMRLVRWYSVATMQSFIQRTSPVTTLGNSKDGAATGAGYLIPASTYFIYESEVPDLYVGHVNWEGLTDRQAGLVLGEEIVSVLFDHRIIMIPQRRAVAIRSREAQIKGGDFRVDWFPEAIIEVKTEMLVSKNVFVQTHERGHRVHLAQDEGRLVRRVTAAPDLDDDIPF